MNPHPQPSRPDSEVLHLAALEALIASDRALAHAEVAIAEPHRLADCTREWLERTLAGDAPGARLEELVEIEAHDGMTARKKWRLEWNRTGREIGLPSSIFVKATPHLLRHREMLSILHMDEAEVRFYRSLRAELPDIAPKSYYAASYGGGRSLIILEDLLARGCRPFWKNLACPPEHARAIAVTLARLHAIYWASDRLEGDLAWVRPRTRHFGWPWLRQAHHDVRSTVLDTASEETLPEHAREALTLWHEVAARVFDHWDTKPLTVLHGDSHLGNTYSSEDGSSGFFDWQVILAGYGLRDLAYFTYSAFTDEQRRKHEREVFQLYLEALAERGIALDRDEAWNDYCLFMFDAWDAGLMILVQGTFNHPAEGQLRQFETIAGALKDHDITGRLRSLARSL